MVRFEDKKKRKSHISALIRQTTVIVYKQRMGQEPALCPM